MVLLDPTAAAYCPVKVENAFHPGLERPPSGSGGLPGAQEFLTGVLNQAAGGQGRVVDLRGFRGGPADAHEAACVQAMADGVDVILSGLLPRDLAGHRSGRPDLLIRHEGGYVPGVVKAYKLLEPRGDGSAQAVSRPQSLGMLEELPDWRFRWRTRSRVALQLAHFHRMLEALGQAAGPLGVAVGNDEIGEDGLFAAWLDLSEQTVALGGGQPAPEEADATTALERYDFEFANRLAIAEQAAAAGPSDPPVLLPIVVRECDYCPWWEVCRSRLDDNDLSLVIRKSPMDRYEIQVLREEGVVTATDLAAADLDALLPDYLPRVTHRAGAEDRLRKAQRRSLLLLDGVELERISDSPVDLRTADLEIDLDVETSFSNKVYLWGFWVSDRLTGESGYVHFSDFSELDTSGELALAREALGWLRDRVDGRDALVYHYSRYETDRIAELAQGRRDPVLDWAVGFTQERFVDLFGVVKQHFFGIQGLGLKVVAAAGAGFSWRDENPGGLNSMHWFEDAVSGASEEVRDQARTRVLEYNEDDVRATLRVRDWLRTLD